MTAKFYPTGRVGFQAPACRVVNISRCGAACVGASLPAGTETGYLVIGCEFHSGADLAMLGPCRIVRSWSDTNGNGCFAVAFEAELDERFESPWSAIISIRSEHFCEETSC